MRGTIIKLFFIAMALMVVLAALSPAIPLANLRQAVLSEESSEAVKLSPVGSPALGMIPEEGSPEQIRAGRPLDERIIRKRLVSPIPGGASQGFALLPVVGRPDVSLPIGLKLVGDVVDDQGNWLQTFRVTIQPEGTLFYVALALYDDPGRADEMFEVMRQQAPGVTNPAQVRPGLSFRVTVDAARTYVLGQATLAPDGTKTRLYYNGVREVLYPGGRSVRHEVEFPPALQTPSFTFVDQDATLEAPAGSKLVEYQYVPQEDFAAVLRQIYGVASIPALQDFVKQTGWDLSQQPPQPGQVFRLTVPTAPSYADAYSPRVAEGLNDLVAKQQIAELLAQRERAGVRLRQVGPSHHLYQVGVMDPTLTARGLSKLLYGREDRYLRLASLAGVEFPGARSGPLVDRSQPAPQPPPDFDPLLFGRVFEVRVDLADEYFVWRQGSSEMGGRTVTLLNGATIEEYRLASRNREGIRSVVTYPSGYRKVVYEPNRITLTALDGLVFAYQLFRPAPPQVKPDDTRFDAKQRLLQGDRLQILPGLIWDWDLAAPRQLGDVAEEVRWAGDAPGQAIEVVLRPPEEVKPIEAFRQGQFYLKVLPVAAVGGIIFAFLMAAIFARRRR